MRLDDRDASAKYHNLRRDPWAALYMGRDDFAAFVVLEGVAELAPVAAHPEDATVEELVELHRGLRGEHHDRDGYRRMMVTEHRTVVRLHPTRAYGGRPTARQASATSRT